MEQVAIPLQDTLEAEAPASLAEQAYLLLEQRIVTLELAPGARITEAALIEQTGMGRTPLREAVQRLAWEGLLTIRPRSGLEITPLVAGDWLKIIEARRGIEAVLARGAARAVSRRIAEGLTLAAVAMRDAVEARDTRAFLAADKAFDRVLAEAAGNDYAARLAQPLQTHSRRYWFANARADSLGEAAEHHIDLINAILSGDGELAAAEALRLMALLQAMAETGVSG